MVDILSGPRCVKQYVPVALICNMQAISQGNAQKSITKTCSQISHLKSYPHLIGANELSMSLLTVYLLLFRYFNLNMKSYQKIHNY